MRTGGHCRRKLESCCIKENLSLSDVPRLAPRWKYPRGTSQIKDTETEEAEPHWSRSCQENTEMERVLSLIRNGKRRPAEEEENGWTAACGDEQARDKDKTLQSRGKGRPEEEDGGREDSFD
ncbi:hypothetical protein NDU88_006266 [Pleurodeles waltl]|uniref:Uncharacterized protein n=1 Tax=Pleurodeles waltl TaxID=8319 RepID=A0AAV7QHK2_PLEWA|nr:hypothetical protein NDU88_006266 [Pleurodeles waltl]